MAFSTLNESNLHKTIKVLYAEETDGNTEVELYGHIYDIVTKDNSVIEIQTRNLAQLLPKILDTIDKGIKIKIVHPVVVTKTIETYKDGKLLSKRKSPKKGSIYSIFRELTGLYIVLLNPFFELEVLLTNITEQREKLDEAVQSKNNNRRFKKDWIKTNKKLDEITETRLFRTKEDYLALLPSLPEIFSAVDLKQAFRTEKNLPSSSAAESNLILWVLAKMNLIELVKTENRKKYYKIK